MLPGQPATIHIDAFPGKTFKGHVDSLQSGTGSRFSLLPPENATGNYVKVVQRVPVKIRFDESPEVQSAFAPGLSVVTGGQTSPPSRRGQILNWKYRRNKRRQRREQCGRHGQSG